MTTPIPIRLVEPPIIALGKNDRMTATIRMSIAAGPLAPIGIMIDGTMQLDAIPARVIRWAERRWGEPVTRVEWGMTGCELRRV